MPKKPARVEMKDVKSRVEAKIKKASEFDPNQNFLFYGISGAGKTRLAATAPNPLIVDVDEEGTDSVRRDIDPHVYRVKFWSEINDIYWYLQSGDHDFRSVVIDGATGLQTLCLNFVLGDEAARDASRDPDMPSRQVWGKVGQLMRVQITNFRNLPLNTIFTALPRTRDTGDGEEEEVLVTGPAVSPSIQNHLVASVGTIGYLMKREVIVKTKKGEKKKVTRRRLLLGDNERFITKDRNGLFGEYIDGPDITQMLELIYGKEA